MRNSEQGVTYGCPHVYLVDKHRNVQRPQEACLVMVIRGSLIVLPMLKNNNRDCRVCNLIFKVHMPVGLASVCRHARTKVGRTRVTRHRGLTA